MKRLLVLLAVAVATAAPVASAPAQHAASVAAAPAVAPVHAGPIDSIRAGDVIRLRIWREPDLSGEFPVDVQGQVTLPKLGPMQVGGSPADSVRTKLVESYSQFLRQASVDVTVLRRVRVAGAVRNPGLFTVDPTITVGDVLVLAGGALPEGDLHHVRLVRDGVRVSGAVARDANIGALAVRSGDQLEVPQRSWASRNVGAISAIIGSSAFLISSIFRR